MSSRRIGLIAGNGWFPIEFAKNARTAGVEVCAIGLRGETNPQIEEFVSELRWIRLGQLGRLIRYLKEFRIDTASFVGGVNRKKTLGGVRPDWRGFFFLRRLASLGDDSILSAVAREVEEEGIAVVAPNIYLADWVAQRGVLTNRAPTKAELHSAKFGWEAAQQLGELDIGQAVVVRRDIIIAVEGVEGTDRLIERAGQLSRHGTVVVKLPKPTQDLRLDLPAIGEKTIEKMSEAGSTALFLKHEGALLYDPPTVVRRANEAGISIAAYDSLSDFEGY